MAGDKRRKTMGRNQRMAGTILVVALVTSLFIVGTARAQAQSPVYVGKFTLSCQVVWGKSVLQPGNYTITIKSIKTPIIALVRNAKGDAVTYVMSGAESDHTNGANALLIKEKDGQFRVYSLALSDLGMVLIYDPTLPRETVQDARASQTIPVMWAKKR
jgi:hypothetical protein